MTDQTSHTFAQAASKALTAVAASPEQSMKGSTTSDSDHKRAFLETFRRWEILFKRKDGDVESAKWLIAEYYKSLAHLSEDGFNLLTDILKETCIFFPTIKECLDVTRFGKYDWAHPFRCGGKNYFRLPIPEPVRLSAPAGQIGYAGD